MSTTEFQPVLSRNSAKIAHAMEQLVDKNAPVPEIREGTAVHVPWLTVAERKGLLEGPKADIYVGEKVAFHGAPIRALMAWSAKASKHFLSDPLSRKVSFPEDKATVKGVSAVLKATITNYGMGGDNLGKVHMGNNFIHMVHLWQAGNVLDMSDRVFHVLVHMQHLISANLLTYDQVTAVINAVDPEDPLFQHLARDLAYRRFQRRIPDPHHFEKYVHQHPTLKTAMAEADAPHKAECKAIRDAAHEAKVKEENRKYAAEQKRLENKYRARIAALKEKINSATGGIISLSAEEAELKRKLGI